MKTKNTHFTNQFLPLLLATVLGLLSFLKIVQADALGTPSYSIRTAQVITSEGSVSNAPISSVIITPISSVGVPGELIQIVSAVRREGSDAKENITSCFPCPTANNSSEGRVTYEIVSGPAHMEWSKVRIHEEAKMGDKIILRARYYDQKSQTEAVSHYATITVAEAPLQEASSPLEEGEMIEVDIDHLQEGELDPAADEIEEEVDETKEAPDSEMDRSEILENEEIIESKAEDQLLTDSVESDVIVSPEESDKVIQASEKPVASGRTVYWVVLILILLALAGMVAKKRMRKIDQLPPEHRAKENELYEAFGEKHHDHSIPENHAEKEKEVEEAFGK